MSSLAFSVLYGMSMKPAEAETWLTGQFLNVLIDVLLMPIIKITISGVFIVYFLKDHFEKYSNVMMNRIRIGYLDSRKSPTSGNFRFTAGPLPVYFRNLKFDYPYQEKQIYARLLRYRIKLEVIQ